MSAYWSDFDGTVWFRRYGITDGVSKIKYSHNSTNREISFLFTIGIILVMNQLSAQMLVL